MLYNVMYDMLHNVMYVMLCNIMYIMLCNIMCVMFCSPSTNLHIYYQHPPPRKVPSPNARGPLRVCANVESPLDKSWSHLTSCDWLLTYSPGTHQLSAGYYGYFQPRVGPAADRWSCGFNGSVADECGVIYTDTATFKTA